MNKRYKLINSIAGFIVFGISLWQYTSTLESAGSLWDCGEFASCVYKLQVAHPPGAPFFMLLGRIFTLLNPHNPVIMVNFLSGLMSAGCILFLFWTITMVAKKLLVPQGKEIGLDDTLAIVGAGAVGALACSFSDTMWFSAVEGEVYASSMFFISIVLWAVMKWNEEAEQPYGNRWLVFAAYMIGVSLGVHLLSLLVIPVAVIVYYFKKFKPTVWGFIIAFIVGFILLGSVQIGVVQTAIKLAGGVEYFFVNGLGMPFNIGFVFAWVILVAVLVFLIYYAHKIKHADLQLLAVCYLVIFIGFSSYIMVPIRAAANPPINMNNPKDAFSLLSYLNREQYGSRALIKGPLFDAQPTSYVSTGKDYYQDPKTKRYEVKGEKIEYTYNPEDEMLFPRMGPTNDGESAASLYQYWTGYQGKPTFGDNIKYFFNYQIRYMYWRYFLWNFAGRQDDYQGTPSNERMNGDWLSGISIIDNAHLGSQDGLPYQILNQKARNKFYLLPLLLGIIGLVYMYSKNKNYTIIFGLLWLVTGIALIVYTNQPPREPRERDYALVGSFFAFCIWIGLAVTFIYEYLKSKKMPGIPVAIATTIICLFVPFIMAKAGWDDHNRHGRYMARDFAANYLESCPPNAILFTQGDNDTYPLWYAQEVEGIRTDVRIVNLSLLGVDWYIDFLHRASNKSGPIPFYKDFTTEKYRGNNRDMIQFNDQSGFADASQFYDVQNIMAFILSDDPQYKAQTSRGEAVNYLPTTKLKLKVDRAAIEKYGVVPDQYKDKIVDEITWDLGKNRIIKYDLAVLAMVAAADWSRPICFSNTVESVYYNGLDKYLMQEGEILRLMPCRFEENQRGYYAMNTQKSYDILMKKFKYGGMGEREMFVDENSSRIMNTLKSVHFGIADDLIKNNKKQEAVNVLERIRKEFTYANAPYYTPNNRYFNILSVQWIDLYYRADAKEKSKPIKDLLIKDLKDCLRFYNIPNDDFAALYGGEKKSAEEMVKRMEMLAIMYKDEEFLKQLNTAFPSLVQSASIDKNMQLPMQAPH
ncbi:MAG: rane protein [Bacteroidota bacterium]|nr:rane protein [Bacteroidota bacterium]